MAQKERRNEQGGADRRQNRTILGRTIFLMAVFGVVAFVPLLWKLWQIQIVDYRFYQEKAISQQTRDMLVTAPRGTIYDSQGNILAVSTDVYNVVISPKDILAAEETKAKSGEQKAAKGKELTGAESAAMAGRYQEFVAEGLAEILGVETDTILKRMENTASQYEVLQWRVDDSVSEAVRAFQEENGLYPGVYLLPDTKRVYPYSSLAAQVIGWVNVNDSNRGAYGIEAKYESQLAGEPGRWSPPRRTTAPRCSPATRATWTPSRASTSSSPSTPPSRATVRRPSPTASPPTRSATAASASS